MDTVAQYGAEYPRYQRVVAANTYDAAHMLLEDGCAYVPYDASYEKELTQLFRGVLERKSCEELSKWSFAVYERPDGRYDPDEGIMDYAGIPGKDDKFLCHWRSTLADRLTARGVQCTKADLEFFEICKEVFARHCSLVFQVAQALDGRRAFPFSLHDELNAAYAQMRQPDTAVPTSLSVLRILYYVSQQNHVIGKPHVDRDGLTLHVGGNGGQLIANVHGTCMDVSPREGEALVFFGAKLAEYAKEYGCSIIPLEHAAMSTGGSRDAVVSFHQIRAPVMFDAPAVKW